MPKIPIDRIDHIVLDSGDIEKTLAYYSMLPGVKTSMEHGRGTAKIGRQKLNIHVFPPILSPVAADPVMGGQIFWLNAGGDSRAFGELLRSKGFSVTEAEEHRFLTDPDGNRIGILRDVAAAPRAFTGIAGLELASGDLEASLRFYSRLGTAEDDGSGKGVLVRFADGFVRLSQDGTLNRGAGDFCLITDMDIREARARLKDEFILEDMGIVDRTGALGSMRSFYSRDPDGDLVEIAAYPPRSPSEKA